MRRHHTTPPPDGPHTTWLTRRRAQAVKRRQIEDRTAWLLGEMCAASERHAAQRVRQDDEISKLAAEVNDLRVRIVKSDFEQRVDEAETRASAAEVRVSELLGERDAARRDAESAVQGRYAAVARLADTLDKNVALTERNAQLRTKIGRLTRVEPRARSSR